MCEQAIILSKIKRNKLPIIHYNSWLDSRFYAEMYAHNWNILHFFIRKICLNCSSVWFQEDSWAQLKRNLQIEKSYEKHLFSSYAHWHRELYEQFCDLKPEKFGIKLWQLFLFPILKLCLEKNQKWCGSITSNYCLNLNWPFHSSQKQQFRAAVNTFWLKNET